MFKRHLKRSSGTTLPGMGVTTCVFPSLANPTQRSLHMLLAGLGEQGTLPVDGGRKKRGTHQAKELVQRTQTRAMGFGSVYCSCSRECGVQGGGEETASRDEAGETVL